jgi:hypothetical protein
MGKLLKIGGIVWTSLGVLFLGLSTVLATHTTVSTGAALLMIFFLFVLPGVLAIGKGQRMIEREEREWIASLPPSPPTPAPRLERPCPWCAEPILVDAVVCKHCGRDVRRRLGIDA